MQLNPAAFNALLGNFAEPFLWRKSYACPCLNPASGSPLAGCPLCGGKGRLWNAPVPVSAAVSSSSTQQEWAKFGQWESGDQVLSIPENSPLYDIAMYDRVTSLTSSDEFSLVLVRGAATERLHGSIQSISRVFWIVSGTTTVDGSVPVVADDGTLSWPSGGAPPDGASYSITGIRRNEYYCFGPFSNDRMKHGGLRLPRKMVMRKFDLFGRNGSN